MHSLAIAQVSMSVELGVKTSAFSPVHDGYHPTDDKLVPALSGRRYTPELIWSSQQFSKTDLVTSLCC